MTVLEAVPPVVAPERRRLMGSAYDLAGATNADEARVLAGLEWEAEHRPLFTQGHPVIDTEGVETETYDLVTKERAVVRSDNGEMFGVVGREHRILSNREMFDFADTLLAEADTTWATSSPFGGALADGKQPFLAFRLGDDIQVAGQDAVNTTVLLSNGHVGNSAFVLTVTPERTACSNIVRAAIRAGKAGKNLGCYTIQHSGDLGEKMKQAREALAITSIYMREFATLADKMASIDFGLSEFEDFLTELVPISDAAGDRAKATAEAQRAAFRRNWRTTPTLDADLRSTAWGAINVVAEVLDHGSLDVRRSAIPAAERRMRSVHFGTGARLRDRAYSLLGGVR